MTFTRKTTIVPILWNRKNKDGEFPLKVRVTVNRKSKYYPIGVFLKKTDWSEHRHLVKSTHPNYKEINYQLQNLIQQLVSKYDRVDKVGNHTEVVYSFTDYLVKYINQQKKGNRFHSSKRYNTLFQHLISFWGHDDIRFYDLTPEFIVEFRHYLESNIGPRSLQGKPSDNTINNYLKALSSLINKSIDDAVFNGDSPFKRGHVPSRKKTSKITLNRKDIWFLENLDQNFEGMNKGMWDAKNIFLFSFWAQGIRIGDALQLKYGYFEDGYFNINVEKTNRNIRFPLTEENVVHLMEYIPGVPGFYDWAESLFYSTNLKEGRDENFKSFGDIPCPLTKEVELLGGHTNRQEEKHELYKIMKGQLPILNNNAQENDRVKFYFDDQMDLYGVEFYESLKKRENPIDIWYFNRYENAKRLYARVCLNYFKNFASNPKNRDLFVFPYLRGLENDRSSVRWNKISSSTALVNKNLAKISERYNIRKFSTHYARHTFTSLSKEMGADIYDLKRWLGHSSVLITEGYINSVDSGGSEVHNQRLRTFLGG